MVHKLGLNKENVYDDLKAAVVAAPQFRYVVQLAVQVHITLCLPAGSTGSLRAELRWSSRGDAIL